MPDSTPENEPLLPAGNGDASNNESVARRYMLRKALPYGLVTLILFVIVVILLIVLVEPYKVDRPIDDPRDSPLSDKLQTSAIFAHLEQLYDIALKHNNSRSVMNGYLASAAYVQTQLKEKAAGFCELSTQEFKVPVWKELEEPHLSSLGLGGDQVWIEYQNKIDFQNFRYNGPSASLEHQGIQGVDNHGCAAKDHKKVGGKIAIIEEGSTECDLWTAAYHAQKAGATGILFYNSPSRKALLYSNIRVSSWKEGDPLIAIPVLSITNSLGSTLLQNQHSTTLSLATKNSQTVESTINVLCTTMQGQTKDTIVIGAHLDSVPEGPGIVDNGSGSSAVLEIVLTLAKNAKSLEIRNRVVFAWWGAEEIGLLGSKHYVRDLVHQGLEAKQNIALNLNFDMLASPNYVPFIHNGTTAPEALMVPSLKLDSLLAEYFHFSKKDFEYAALTRGSDYRPFLTEGIPAGGLMTGASSKKTMDQRKRFGGVANAQLDPCYHKSCDTLDNVSKEALELMSQAALHAITKLSIAKDLRGWLSEASVQM